MADAPIAADVSNGKVSSAQHTGDPRHQHHADAILELPAPAGTQAHAPQARRNQEYFRLLHLPSELVVRVLELALSMSSIEEPLPITIRGITYAVQPALTGACRLLRFEGLKLFYSRNVFLANSSEAGARAFGRWANCIGPQNRRHVQQLFVSWEDAEGGKIMDFDFVSRPYLADLWEEFDFLREVTNDEALIDTLWVQCNAGKVVIHGGPALHRYRVMFGEPTNEQRDYLAVGGLPKDFRQRGSVEAGYVDQGQESELLKQAERHDFWTFEG